MTSLDLWASWEGAAEQPEADRAWIEGNALAAAEALQRAPAGRRTDLDRGVALLGAHQRRDAQAALERLATREPLWLPALRWRARALADSDSPDALERARELLAVPEADSRDHLWAAGLFARHGEAACARNAYRVALDLEPDLYLAWLGLGDAEDALGHHGAAHAAWMEARERHPGCEPLLRIARGLLAAGQQDSARVALEAALDAADAAAFGADLQALAPDLAPRFAAVPRPILWPGERLRFEGRFLGLSCATVAVEQESGPEGAVALEAQLEAHTALRLDSRFRSVLGPEGTVRVHTSVARDALAGHRAARYEMDRARGVCRVRWVDDGLYGFEELPLPPLVQDGLSLMSLARSAARADRTLSALAALRGAWRAVKLVPTGCRRERWRGEPHDAVRVECRGIAHGPGGVHGPVTLVIGTEPDALPLRLEVRTALGPAVLDLQDAHRPVRCEPAPAAWRA